MTPKITLSQLTATLVKLMHKHGDIPVVCTRYSDYRSMELDDVSIISLVPVKGAAGEWMRQAHHSEPPNPEAIKVVHFEGN